MDLGKEYLRVIKERFSAIKELGDKTIIQLSEDDVQWRLNETTNSVAILVKHLRGNMISRWTDFLTTDGEKSYRNRDEEFEETISSKQQLITVWEQGWTVLFDTLNGLEDQDLMKSITIRGERHTVLEAVERQVAHYAYHIGQIVFIGKQLKAREWGNLSIPKGKSAEYLQHKLGQQH